MPDLCLTRPTSVTTSGLMTGFFNYAIRHFDQIEVRIAQVQGQDGAGGAGTPYRPFQHGNAAGIEMLQHPVQWY